MIELEIIQLLKKISAQLGEVSARQVQIQKDIRQLTRELEAFGRYTQRLEERLPARNAASYLN